MPDFFQNIFLHQIQEPNKNFLEKYFKKIET